MEQQHRLYKFTARLAVGVAMGLLVVALLFMARTHQLEEYIKDVLPATIKMDDRQGECGANILYV